VHLGRLQQPEISHEYRQRYLRKRPGGLIGDAMQRQTLVVRASRPDPYR
jgi:hypothetical protein